MTGYLTSGLATVEIIGCDDCTENFVFADEARTRGFVQTDEGDWLCEDCHTAAPAPSRYDRAYS
jgi:hypothetical protein